MISGRCERWWVASVKTCGAFRTEVNTRMDSFDTHLCNVYAGHGIEMDGVNYLVPVDARLERDVDVRFETVTVDDLLVSTSGASLRLVLLGCVPEQPAGALDAAYGGDPYGERGQLRRPERGLAGGRDAGGVCGGGGNDGGGRAGSEQSVHGGAAVASGNPAGDPG